MMSTTPRSYWKLICEFERSDNCSQHQCARHPQRGTQHATYAAPVCSAAIRNEAATRASQVSLRHAVGL